MKLPSLLLLTALTVAGSATIKAQTPPMEMHFSTDSHRLIIGGLPSTGFYDESVVRNIGFTFPQANYWTLLTQNYASKTNLLANMTVDGVAYDSVGIRFKGNTSYMNVQNSQKKSFNISTDFVRDWQDVDGYSTLNLNNSFEDESFMREVFYLHQIRKHIPAAKANYVNLTINGQNWGVYPNVQQINKDFLKEWYMTNNGTNWRADKPSGTSGGGPGGGPQWGDGTAALNYLGNDTTTYKTYYTLKSTEKPSPWTDLVNTCDVLNNTSPVSNLTTALPPYLDIDRTLWFLASEIAFTDDDSYVYKGKMDYYVYWEKETGRLVPQEFDGNSAIDATKATTWSPFYNETKVNYPLLNKLLSIPELRQRYIAHLNTIIQDEFDTTTAFQTLDAYKTQINALVQADPKKLYTYNAFLSEINVLKNFIKTRRNYLLSNSEVAQPRPAISNVAHSFNDEVWAQPEAGSATPVTAKATFTTGIYKMYLYYATGLVGNFTRIEMFDDGAHNDTAAGDGIFGASIPAQAPGLWVRYYIEAVANNPAKSVSYSPAGAEHDVYVFLTKPRKAAETNVVINEIMAANSTVQADEAGEFDDWIELYNRSQQTIDISGWYITDNNQNIDKWVFPAGTVLAPGAYLIVWADEDSSQGTYHCNFKLSADGETLMLLNTQKEIVDEVTYTTQTTDLAYDRIPNGTGSFVIKTPTFNANNEGVTPTAVADLTTNTHMHVYPNPAGEKVYVLLEDSEQHPVLLTDAYGRTLQQSNCSQQVAFTVSNLPAGVYFIRCGNLAKKLLVQR